MENESPDSFDATEILRDMPNLPGVYRMFGADGDLLYVGKAKRLKKRVTSYFQKSSTAQAKKTLITLIRSIEITVTHTEVEALLLEANLIKKHLPRFNILLRDDKSFPYVFLSAHQDFPRLAYHRGARRAKGQYFGPYPNAGAVRESLNLLQKLFRVRQCDDTFYGNRSRPCLQYQIKRCTAPCVDLITADEYARDVQHTKLFLQGKSNAVIDDLVQQMEAASADLEYELAAECRDQIANLRKVQERQYISGQGGDLDVVAAACDGGLGCIQVFFIRGGHNLGNKTFFPKMPADCDEPALMEAFLAQFYLARAIPTELLLNQNLEDEALVAEMLSKQAGHRVRLSSRLRGDRVRWVKLAENNARQALQLRLTSRMGMFQRIEAVQQALDLDELPERMECFDISHTMGEVTVASCVVFDREGPVKSDYRRFNIKDITPGDDYAAMHQALTRRYTRIKKGEGKLPDILFIDGGKGQLTQALDVLENLQIEGVILIGVAKGPDRKPGEETLFLSDSKVPFILPSDSPALHLVQQIRDEAHRFAISGHRQRRGKVRTTSVLEEIEGIGAKRRQGLLTQFGGLQELSKAGAEDIARVPGISKELARKIYDHFHTEG